MNKRQFIPLLLVMLLAGALEGPETLQEAPSRAATIALPPLPKVSPATVPGQQTLVVGGMLAGVVRIAREDELIRSLARIVESRRTGQ